MTVNAISNSDVRAETKTNTKSNWQLQTPEYLLILVVALILWTFGFVELLNRTSSKPTVLGLYSTSYFAILATYATGFIVWIGLLARPYHSGWLSRTITFIQNRSWLAVGILVLSGIVVWNLFFVALYADDSFSRIAELPVVRFTFAGLIVLFNGLIVFAAWGKNGPVAIWRRAVFWVLAVLAGIEIILQVLLAFNALPVSQSLVNIFKPYSAIYYTAEGFGNGSTNNFGWYYPDFQLKSDSKRIVVLGDTYIQALQIDREEHLGVQLETLLNNNEPEQDIEVLAMGMPGFGPGLYLSETRLVDTIDKFEPDEIILFFHVSNDFQLSNTPTENNIVYNVDEAGNAVLSQASEDHIHNLKHWTLHGYELVIDPLTTVRGKYLTPQVIQAFGEVDEAVAAPAALDMPGFRGYIANQIDGKRDDFFLITETGVKPAFGAGNMMFEKELTAEAAEAIAVAEGLLKFTNDYLASEDVTLRIVTIPAFPSGFYQENSGTSWPSEIGPYNLFGPEQALQEFAQQQDIPFLATGQYLQETGTTVEDIQSLFFLDGLGHFTPAGHTYMADSIYACFFAQEASSLEACTGQ